VTRALDPLGLVLKAGTWYLVAAHDGRIRTYRVSRVRGAEGLDERAVRPDGFDLAAYWADSIAAYERETPRLQVTVRVRRDALRRLDDVIDGRTLRGGVELPDPEPADWVRLRLAMEWPGEVPGRLLAMGTALEVVDPPELREEIGRLAESVAEAYRRRVADEVPGAPR
jgi:predicted DNA-binding transcriptional regulator YafY